MMRRTAVQGNPGLEGGTLSLALGVSARVGTCLGQAMRGRVSGSNSEFANATLDVTELEQIGCEGFFSRRVTNGAPVFNEACASVLD